MPGAAALLRDRLFLLALLAGPLCWLSLYLILQPAQIQWHWPLREPAAYLMPVLVFPVIEEIVFRGLLQPAVARRLPDAFGPLSVANVLTSVLFTGLHFIYQPPLWAALVFFPSLVFGFFRERSAALTAPIILHVFYNAGFLWLFVSPLQG